MAVALPALRDSIGSFDIIEQDSLVRLEGNGEVELRKNFVIAKYDAGNYYIRPYVVEYRDANGKMENVQSNPIPVEIRGIEVDTTQTIRDVKPQMSLPFSAEEIALYAGIILALAGIVYGVYYYSKKKKLQSGEIREEAAPAIPPYVLALMQLDELEAKRLWQAGEFKAYYSEATEIIRRYFELRYGFIALEMTSGEVMEQLAKFSIEKTAIQEIDSLLTQADLVKFAKYQPAAAENEQVIHHARSIVEKTKPPLNQQAEELAA